MSKSTVLVTGASSGFGELISRRLAENGYRVFASMREVNGRNEDKARELRDWAAEKKFALEVVELDVTDDTSVERAVSTVRGKAGGVDVVVNNAGFGAVGVMETFTPDQMRAVFDVNLFGVHRVNRAVLPQMRECGSGLLVHISSVIGRTVFPFVGAYCPSKFALEAYAESLRQEYAAVGVDSVLVEPGAYGTGFQERMQMPADSARAESLGELGEAPAKMFNGLGDMLSGENAPDPDDVAKAVLALIETPAGERPLRTVVDAFSGPVVTRLNDDAEAAQQELMKAFGM